MILKALSILLSLSNIVVGIPPVGRTEQVDIEKLYVNAHGESIIPQEFIWGRYVMKEKDAARNRTTCTDRMDPSGRLGKRQAVRPGLGSTLYMVFDWLISTVLMGSTSLVTRMQPVPAVQVTPPFVRTLAIRHDPLRSSICRLLCWNCVL